MAAKEKLEYSVIHETVCYLIKNKIQSNNKFDLYREVGSKICDNQLKFFSCLKYTFGESIEIEINNEIIKHFEKIPYFLFHFEFLKSKKIEQLMQLLDLCSNNNNDNLDYIYILAILFRIDQMKTNFDDSYYISQLTWNLINKSKNTKLICDLDSTIEMKYRNIHLNKIIKNQYILDYLSLNDINNLSDLLAVKDFYKIIMYNYDFIAIKDTLAILSTKGINILKEKTFELFYRLTPRQENLIRLRYGIGYEKDCTLDEIGNVHNITRERARQILKKAEDKLKYCIFEFNMQLRSLYDFLKSKGDYCFFKEFIDFIDDVEFSQVIIMLFDLFDICKVNYNNKLLYDKKINIDDVIEDISNQYPMKMTVEEINNINELHREIVLRNYKQFNNYYVRKSVSRIYLLSKVLDEEFNGFIDFNTDQFEKLKTIMMNEYGLEDFFFDLHYLGENIKRIGYILIGNRIYLKKDLALRLPKHLRNEIMDYLLSLSNPILYSVLYEKHKEELIDIGINTVQYFKSLIDDILPDELVSSKSYISPAKINNPIEHGINVLNSFEGVFSFKDIEEKLSTYSNISIQLLIDRERKRDLITLLHKNYIYGSKVNISNETKELLNNCIENNFQEDIASLSNIYTDIYYNYPEIFKEIPIFKNSYNFYSLLEYLFGHKYHFHRPLISKSNRDNFTVTNIITEHFSAYNVIMLNQIHEYIDSLGVWNYYTGHNLIKLFAEEFVLINNEKLINKNIIDLFDFQIEDIETILNLIISKEHVLDTSTSKSLRLLPQISYPWNNYLLLGIIESFLSDKFEIYDIADFRDLNYKARRIVNE